MTWLTAGRLVVSLPAAEIANISVPGSVMRIDQVLGLPISHALACALFLIEYHCGGRGIETVYLARPEIFAHGTAAAWLAGRLGPVSEHLCVTDGSAVKLVSGCRTHMFAYRLTDADGYAAFARLCRRAPDLMAQVATQVNTRLSWRAAGQLVRPRSLYLHAPEPPPPPSAAAYPFQFKPYLVEETARRVAAAAPVELDALPRAAQTIYVPLTETGLANKAFARAIARLVRAAFAQPHALVLLRLPAERAGESLAGRIGRTLIALAASGVVLPRNAPSNIYFLSADLSPETAPPNLFITVHEDFDFWRHPKRFYEQAMAVTVAASQALRAHPEFLPLDVTPIYGARATRLWLPPFGLGGGATAAGDAP
jgi:hypothetical protein